MIYNNFDYELQEMMFNHNMECLYAEQSFVNDILQLRYNGIVNENTDIQVLQEGVIEAIKNVILAIFKKIKELFDKLISLFRGVKQKEQEKKIDEELKKCEQWMNDTVKNTVGRVSDFERQKDDLFKNAENNSKTGNDKELGTDFVLKGNSYGNSKTAKDKFIQRQAKGNVSKQLPSFTGRTIKVYNVQGFGFSQVLTSTVNGSRIYFDIDNIIDNIGTDFGKKGIEHLMKKDKDFYISNFYNSLAEETLATFNSDKLMENANGSELPPNLKKWTITYLDRMVEHTFDNEDDMKNYIKSNIKTFRFYRDHNKQLIEDINRCKSKITDLENGVHSIRNSNQITEAEMNKLLSLVSLLQSLINNSTPLRALLTTKITRNIYYNLKVLNKLAEDFGIAKF